MKSPQPIIPAVLTTSPEVFSQHLEFAANNSRSIHIDVIDNQFCPGKTLAIDAWPEVKIEYSEAHLMVSKPIEYLEKLAGKVTRAIIHIESDFEVIELADRARRLDLLLGWAVNPDTDLDKLRNFYSISNYIQLMGVHPGSTGQKIVDTTASAVTYLANSNNRRLIVSVDGGVNSDNIESLKNAGANYFVSSAAIFEKGNTWQDNYQELLEKIK